MNKKDRRITLFLEFFFLVTGLYIITFQTWVIYSSDLAAGLFQFNNGSLPVFDVLVQYLTGLASFIACWALWARTTWAAGWCMFTLGLLLYHNIHALGLAVHNRPAATIPIIIIILIVMQSFPFLIKHTRRY